MISTSPMPLATAGRSASSVLSRIEAIKTNASVRPPPAPMAKKSPCTSV
jgi:hypothetical protein